MLKHENKGMTHLSSAVNNGASYLGKQMVRRLPQDAKSDGVHIKNAVKQSKAKVDKNRSLQNSAIIIGSKNVIYPMSLEFGHRSKNKKVKVKPKEYVKKIIYDESVAEKSISIVMDTLLKKLGM